MNDLQNKVLNVALVMIIIMIGYIAFLLSIRVFNDKCPQSSKNNFEKINIKSNHYLDFENAIIDNDKLITNDHIIPIHHSSESSVNASIDINRSYEGNKSISFNLPSNEGRSEIMIIDIPNNTIKYVGFSVYFPNDYKIPTNWNLFAQWWQGSPASPPIAFEIAPNTKEFKMRILTRHGQYQDNNITVQYDQTIEKGKWINFIVEMRIDDSGGLNGILNVWKNGKQIVKYNGPLGYRNLKDNTNFRVGLYRYPFINSSANIYFDKIEIGDKLEIKSNY